MDAERSGEGTLGAEVLDIHSFSQEAATRLSDAQFAKRDSRKKGASCVASNSIGHLPGRRGKRGGAPLTKKLGGGGNQKKNVGDFIRASQTIRAPTLFTALLAHRSGVLSSDKLSLFDSLVEE